MGDANPEGTVLVIDDEPDFLKITSLRLSKQGHFMVLTAQDGQDGLEIARTGHPDVILVDLVMPRGIDGHQVLQHLKEDPRTADIPVIIISSVGQPQEVSTSLNLGAVCHMTKPFNLNELLRELKLAVMRHRQAHPPS